MIIRAGSSLDHGSRKDVVLTKMVDGLYAVLSRLESHANTLVDARVVRLILAPSFWKRGYDGVYQS